VVGGAALVSWRVGKKLGRTLYRNDVCVGFVDTPAIAAEIVSGMNAGSPTRVDGSYAHSAALSMPPTDILDAPKTIPAPAFRPVKVPRTESGAQRSILVHFRKMIGEETAAARAYEEEIRKLRKDAKVQQYLTALTALEESMARRDTAARDLGYAIAGEKQDGR
jgi:hypothetical protein